MRLVFLNPATTTDEIDALLDEVVAAAAEVRRSLRSEESRSAR